MLKGSTCCDGEEDDENTDDGCCEDEEVVLLSSNDFIVKANSSYQFVKISHQVPFLQFNLSQAIQLAPVDNQYISNTAVPVQLQKQDLIASFILRI